MKILMNKNAFSPNETSKARSILKKGTVKDLDDDAAKILIEKGYATEIKPAKAEKPKKEEAEKPAKAEKSATPTV